MAPPANRHTAAIQHKRDKHRREDMLYDGTHLNWYGQGSYPATSGLKDESGDYRAANFQTQKDHGPIPDGRYALHLTKASAAQVQQVGPGQYELLSADGIQDIEQIKLPGGSMGHSSAWGDNRVKLHTLHIDNAAARNRGGFFIHDSHKGYTHGCVEVAPQFFHDLRRFAAKHHWRGTLVLKVRYPKADSSTHGDTDRP
jgi:hypothetical protein